MTSAKNPHSSNLQQNPTAAAANMTNTNDEPTTSQNHQQQELIRLLAQHFNNQLANRATTISETPLPLPLLHSGSTNNNFQSTLAHYQQQQQLNTNHQQYRLGQDAINFSTRNRALNLEQQQRQMSPTYLGAGGNQRTIRSQPSTLANMNPICLTNPVINTRPSPASLPMMQQQHPTVNCNPFMPDMSIFNALNCFGLPNDQFVLSLQQQYLIQAANAARQLESRLAAEHGDMNGNMNSKIEPTSHETNRQNQQHLSSGKCSTGSSNMAELGSEITSNQSGRELLKFSINTILGRGSPLPANMTGQPTAIDDLRSRTPPSMNPFFNDQSGFLIGNKKFAPDGHHNHHEAQANSNERQQISPDCDPDAMTDVDSEPSPAPNQQQSSNNNNNNSSRLANPEHSQSASSSTTNQQGITSHGMTITGNESQHSAAAAGHQHPSLFLAGPTAFPWTVASRGKPRRGMMRRAVFSDSQRVGLEKRFQLQKYISKQDRKKLADKLGLRDSQVKIWFQNRRMKWRNSKERELLSAGGSREQTLPTRNNPNPDLSDVGETFKRLVSGGTNNIGTA